MCKPPGPAYAGAMPPDPVAYTALGAASSPVFSADGQSLFHLRGAGLPQVWVLDFASSESRQLTAHDEKVALLRRAPGDDRLIYGIDAGGDERQQLWLWDGTSRPLTDAPTVIHGFGAWSPDGGQFSLTANDRDAAHYDILVLDPATGARTRLHEGTHEGAAGPWHPDGNRMIAWTERSSGDIRPFILHRDGTVAAPPRPARDGGARYASLRWTLDGTAIEGLTDLVGDDMALCRIDLETGTATVLHASPGRDVEAWSRSPGGALLATIENDRGYAVLRVGSADGERPVVSGLPFGVVADLAWSPDGTRLAMVASSPTEPPGLWLWQDGTVLPVWRPDCALPVQGFTLVEWASMDGRRIPGWLAWPPGPVPAAGHPAVVWVHGGPASQARANFRPDMQALLAQGYAVLMPNVRGSTGYGRAAMESDDREHRLDSVHDLAAGGRWLAAQPGIGPARVAVMGQSYGGYMVLAAITEHPALWRTAIDFYGIADFGTLLASTGPWRQQHRADEYGDPVRHRALFDRISPLRHVDRIAVPLLVLHGIRDPRVAIAESEQLVEALRARGKPVTYQVFDYAGHGFVRPDDRSRAYAAAAAHLAASL